MNKHTSCFVCEGKSIKPLAGFYDSKGLVKCGNCGFVFMEKIPTEKDLFELYAEYSYDVTEYISPITIKAFHLLLDEFEAYRKTGRLLDVGCGRGWFLVEAKKRGWEVYGSEYSTAAVGICRENGINMKEGVLNPANFEHQDFDVVTSFEVLEHINNPDQEMASIAALLRPGGLFYCTTPNFNSILRFYLKDKFNIIKYPEHLSYYTPSTLTRMITRQPLQRVKFLTTGISLTRIITSKKKGAEKITGENTTDEKLRRDIESKWYLGVAKKVINWLLTATGTGMTLKGYFIKK
jgi:2-polyprenyl-3-methyl-5-hydroxy-6-metoxy-1,4-benzoquinol methylase